MATAERTSATAPKKRPLAARLPWNDRVGRFAPLKATALVLVSLPMLWLIWRALVLGLGARPVIEAVHFVGDWTVYLLLITLAVTPARRLFDWNRLVTIRRILGISALTYILTHLTLYTVDSRLDLDFVAREIVFRVYLSIGFLAILGLLALGATSTDGMVKRMGNAGWTTLHRLIYFIVPLAILHYYMQSKLDVSQPVLMSGFYFWLMGHRLLVRLGYKQGILPLLGLSLAAALLTAAVEVAWYALATGIKPKRVWDANFDLRHQIRPAWWVFATGVGVSIAAEIRRRFAPARPQPRPARAT